MILFSLVRCWLWYIQLVGIQRQKMTSLYVCNFYTFSRRWLASHLGLKHHCSEFSAELWPSYAVPVVEVMACATTWYVHKSLSEDHRSVNQTYTAAAAWKRDLFALVNSSPTAGSWLCSVTVPAVSCCTHTLE